MVCGFFAAQMWKNSGVSGKGVVVARRGQSIETKAPSNAQEQ
jgi:hypothetical protein